jgi:hypothetical protein
MTRLQRCEPISLRSRRERERTCARVPHARLAIDGTQPQGKPSAVMHGLDSLPVLLP